LCDDQVAARFGKTESIMIEVTNIASYFDYLQGALKKMPLDAIEQVKSHLIAAYEQDRMVYLFGNGGSAALASHFACDLGKGTAQRTGKRFRVLALTDNVPMMTAWANDARYEDIFAEQLSNFVRPHDVAFAISGSGNSSNVLRALRVARDSGATTIGLTGFQGGKMRALCDNCMIVPCDNMQIIEDLHLCVAHALFTAVRQSICDSAETAAVVGG
jgi:D-sedoheptulose 7-phosphate isomerase